MEPSKPNFNKMISIGLIVLVVMCAAVFFIQREMQIQVPEWANFFSNIEWDYFRRLVKNYLEDENIPAIFIEQEGYIQFEDGKELGMYQLAQWCLQDYQSEWPVIVDLYFESGLDLLNQEDIFNQLELDYSESEQQLALRLYNSSAEQFFGQKMVFRHDIEGTITVLGLDRDKGFIPINPGYVEKWGKSREELFDIALKNTLENHKPSIQNEPWTPQISVWTFIDGGYAATQILAMEERPFCFGKYGALISIPSDSILHCYPIDSGQVVYAVNLFVPVTAYRAKYLPSSLSWDIYWYYEGQLTILPYRVEDNQWIFSPPPEFSDMLDRLEQER